MKYYSVIEEMGFSGSDFGARGFGTRAEAEAYNAGVSVYGSDETSVYGVFWAASEAEAIEKVRNSDDPLP